MEEGENKIKKKLVRAQLGTRTKQKRRNQGKHEHIALRNIGKRNMQCTLNEKERRYRTTPKKKKKKKKQTKEIGQGK